MTLRVAAATLVLLLSSIATAPAQAPEWLQRWQGPATATPSPGGSPEAPRVLIRPRKPIPRAVKIGVGIGAAFVAVIILALSLRAWRTANVFGRQYTFPVREVPLRLGAPRSGGTMATVKFRRDPT